MRERQVSGRKQISPFLSMVYVIQRCRNSSCGQASVSLYLPASTYFQERPGRPQTRYCACSAELAPAIPSAACQNQRGSAPLWRPPGTPTNCFRGREGEACPRASTEDRKSTRLNSSHPSISYAV